MTRTISNLMTTMLMLVALYLVLRYGANAGRVITSATTGLVDIFTALQARNVPRGAGRRTRARR